MRSQLALMTRFLVACRLTMIALATAIHAGQAMAGAQTDSADPVDRNWQLGLSLGYGLRTNPLLDSDDLPIIAVIDFSWYGERFFFDNGDLGLTFQDNHRYTLNGILRINSERLFFENPNSLLVSFPTSATGSGDNPSEEPVPGEGGLNGGDNGDGGSGGETPTTPAVETVAIDIPERDPALEAGFEFLTDGRWGFLQASATGDISSTHEGYEVGMTLGRSGNYQRFTWSASGSLAWRSHELNNYYYGLTPEEASAQSSAYEPDDGVNWQLRTLVRYYISANLSLGAVVEYERLSDAISDSPFVTDNEITTGYVGVKYSF